SVLQDLFGYRAAMGSIAGLEQAKTIFVIGANPILEQPILDLRLRKAITQGTALVVVNEERRRLDELARHVLRAKPGTEATLVNAMLQEIIVSGKTAAEAE